MADTNEALPPRPEHGIYEHVYNESKGYSHEVISWEGAQAYAALAIAELRAEVDQLKADAERLQGELLAQRSKLKLAEARLNTLLGRQYVTRQRD